ncbi:hypothetical protein BDV40DRAFT_259248 [Aspergillus tamarii]|uniref:Uncharacterized protein n=1 Tax=Aspergillus tamarii TaxID=41984 RepID=A0A5N6V264_ASPTM|nr:hypothetical protein BDV40DRAFT_259248 [Aspergillus tamarii]
MQYAPYSTVRHMIRIFFLLLPLRTIISPPPFLHSHLHLLLFFLPSEIFFYLTFPFPIHTSLPLVLLYRPFL